MTWQEAILSKAIAYGVEAIVRAIIQAVEGEHPHLRNPPRPDGEAANDAATTAALRARGLLATEPDGGDR